MEDRGQYMCQVGVALLDLFFSFPTWISQVNTDPMKMQTAFLEVVIPPDIIYEETSGDMMVRRGIQLLSIETYLELFRCPKADQQN